MNILHIIPSFVPCYSIGGAVNASYQIAKNQAKMRHEVQFTQLTIAKKS